MKKIRAVLLVLSFYLLSFISASAHVKWFVDSEEIIKQSNESLDYSLDDTAVWIWVGVILVVVSIAYFLDRRIKTPEKLSNFVTKYERNINKFAQILLGVFMLVTIQFFWEIIISPTLGIHSTYRYLIQLLQVVIGIMFIFNLYPRVASILLIGFCLGLGFWSGPIVFLENLLLFSLAIYFFIKNSKEGTKAFLLKDHALQILRVGTGVCLVVLAFTEKLAYPELSLAFLEAHPWNFMQPIFPNFSNSLFILSVGASEVIFGLLFIFGYLTRITTVFLAVFLLSSATSMYFAVGDWEPGHVVIYAVAAIFLAFGSGVNPKK